ncbi:MAG: hypothetical protein KR126chlam6_01345, partial [Candidatus Anoxychlamydiales bacterium]|nr:hypothetical protein [Candidatus Anoxychlamydiales bacterium]
MAISSEKSKVILNKQNEIDTYNKVFNRCETIKKILKVSIIILSIAAIGASIGFMVTSFAHIPIYNISSELLLGSAILGTISTSFLSMATLIIAKFQTNLKKPEIELKPLDE